MRIVNHSRHLRYTHRFSISKIATHNPYGTPSSTIAPDPRHTSTTTPWTRPNPTTTLLNHLTLQPYLTTLILPYITTLSLVYTTSIPYHYTLPPYPTTNPQKKPAKKTRDTTGASPHIPISPRRSRGLDYMYTPNLTGR